MVRKLSLALALAVLCTLTISGARKPSLTVSFHLEGNSFEGGKMVQPIKLGNPQKTYYFRRQPELTQRHIQGYYPFPADDGTSFGAAFKLNQNGTDTLSSLSIVGKGRKLLTVVNSEPIDYTVLDKPVTDGYLVVWGGLTKSDLAKFDGKFQRILPARGGGSGAMPERATTPRDDRMQPPPIVDPEEATEPEPKKERKKLFNFGLFRKDS